jgi:uncharacterized protein
MEKSWEQGERTALRRKDRGVEDEAWIRSLLDRTPVGVLATVAGGQPFLNSNLFIYDPSTHSIYLHTARRGRTRDNAEEDGRACFTAFELGRLLPADRALEFSTEYGGVVAFGRLSVVEDATEARRVLARVMDKYAPHLASGVDYESPTDADLARTSVLRLAVEEWNGKRKAVAEDFPGAYRFGEVGGRSGAGSAG